jgi:hypothetical protein
VQSVDLRAKSLDLSKCVVAVLSDARAVAKSEATISSSSCSVAALIASLSALSRRAAAASQIPRPLNGRVLQAASGDLFTQRGGALFYGLARHELISEATVSFDLNANVVVKAQNAFVA